MGALSNFVLSIYIARTLGAAQFGAFSLAFVTYGFAINASRGVSIEPLLIRYSGTSIAIWRRAVAGATGTALLMGFALGICALLAARLIGGTTGLAFVALGLTMPALMLQDSWRHSFFALGRGEQAFLNDAIWTAVEIPLLVLVRMTGHANVFWLVLIWGAGAAVAAAVGPLQARVVPSLMAAADWLARHRDLGPRYLVENTGGNAGDTLRSYSLSYILGIAAIGYIQAANTLMGPFKIIFYGLSLITIPEAVRILRRSPRHLPIFCVAVSTALTVAAMAWGVVLLVGLPRGLGHLMLGSLWRPTYPLVLPALLSVMSMCANTGAMVGLHALGASRRSMRTVLLSSVLVLAAALVGAVIAGTFGTMLFAAVAAWLGTTNSWWHFRKALQESGSDRVPNGLQPRSAGRHRHHRRAQST
jgi:O-antigen/teichoic acid export membrane protein